MHKPSVGLLAAVAILSFTPVSRAEQPLRSLQVVAVRSEASPTWETISANQGTTARNHGGKWVEVQTEEYGYGSNPLAYYQGRKMQPAGTTNIVQGGVLVGHRRTWRYSGSLTTGLFTCQTTNLYLPYTTLYDRITIK